MAYRTTHENIANCELEYKHTSFYGRNKSFVHRMILLFVGLIFLVAGGLDDNWILLGIGLGFVGIIVISLLWVLIKECKYKSSGGIL